jgi:hypothetical protein
VVVCAWATLAASSTALKINFLICSPVQSLNG